MKKQAQVRDLLMQTWNSFAITAMDMLGDLSRSERAFLHRYFLGDFPRSLFAGSASTKSRVRKKLSNPKMLLRVLQVRALILDMWLEWLERNVISLSGTSVRDVQWTGQSGTLHQARARLLETLTKLSESAEKERDELVNQIKMIERKLAAQEVSEDLAAQEIGQG